ncbi:DinB family protein [Kineococcus sp. GCM10028916]|uniref:DinB family protein n=1 Tax=Kineococcus sp. GCM10028916 TaxID=3273394 RepID=UPI0036276895
MDPATTTGLASLKYAFGQMLTLAELLDGQLLNKRPTPKDTNPVGTLILHCCAISEFWLGHVALGRATTRDRNTEFTQTTTAAECRTQVAQALTQAEADLQQLHQSSGQPHPMRTRLPGNGNDHAVLLHVIEELFQHLGQMEVTKDVLLSA